MSTHAKILDDLDTRIRDLLKTPHPLLVILGPTASGKTSLSLELAKKYNAEIVSADSRQIYKYLDISTEKIPFSERENIPHHMISIVEPDQMYTVGEYKRDATRIIDDILARGKLPMLVGGTGLYIRSIVENFDIPHVPPQMHLRLEWQKEAQERGIEYLYEKLQKGDPNAAKSIHPKNLRYIIRALEINEVTKKNKIAQKKAPHYNVLMIGLQWPREELYDRINKRVDSQIERGLLEEIQGVLKKGYDPNLPSMTAIGCKELLPYFEGKMSLAEAKDLIQRNTRAYARRQLVWFRREKNVIWYAGGEAECR